MKNIMSIPRSVGKSAVLANSYGMGSHSLAVRVYSDEYYELTYFKFRGDPNRKTQTEDMRKVYIGKLSERLKEEILVQISNTIRVAQEKYGSHGVKSLQNAVLAINREDEEITEIQYHAILSILKQTSDYHAQVFKEHVEEQRKLSPLRGLGD